MGSASQLDIGKYRRIMAPLLEVRDLRIEFETEEGLITAVDGVSFHVDAGVEPVVESSPSPPGTELFPR